MLGWCKSHPVDVGNEDDDTLERINKCDQSSQKELLDTKGTPFNKRRILSMTVDLNSPYELNSLLLSEINSVQVCKILSIIWDLPARRRVTA